MEARAIQAGEADPLSCLKYTKTTVSLFCFVLASEPHNQQLLAKVPFLLVGENDSPRVRVFDSKRTRFTTCRHLLPHLPTRFVHQDIIKLLRPSRVLGEVLGVRQLQLDDLLEHRPRLWQNPALHVNLPPNTNQLPRGWLADFWICFVSEVSGLRSKAQITAYFDAFASWQVLPILTGEGPTLVPLLRTASTLSPSSLFSRDLLLACQLDILWSPLDSLVNSLALSNPTSVVREPVDWRVVAKRCYPWSDFASLLNKLARHLPLVSALSPQHKIELLRGFNDMDELQRKNKNHLAAVKMLPIFPLPGVPETFTHLRYDVKYVALPSANPNCCWPWPFQAWSTWYSQHILRVCT